MSVKFTFCVLLITLIDYGLCGDEKQMENLKFEKKFIGDLENYIENQENILHFLRKKLLNFKVEHSDASENPEKYFANDLNKFLLLKRLSSDIELLAGKTFDEANAFKEKVNFYRKENILPSKHELVTSALSIARLQTVQGLRTDKLAKGIFGDVKRRNGLSTEDCYQVGKQLNTARVYSAAIEWLTEAMKRYDEYYDRHQVRAVDILEELAISFIGNNQIQEAEKVVKKVLRINSNSRVIKFINTSSSEMPTVNLRPKRFTSTKEDDRMKRQKLCHSSHFLSSNIFTCPI